MKSTKSLALFVAAFMVLVSGAVSIEGWSSDAISTPYQAEMNVYVYDATNPGWSVTTVAGYDAYQAVAGSFNIVTTPSSIDTTEVTNPNYPVMNSNQVITIWSETYEMNYTYPNPEYGQFSSFNGKGAQNGYDWTLYVYSGGNWIEHTVELGWYKAFADYAIVTDASNNSLAVANFAFVYSNDGTLPSASLSTFISSNPLKSLTVVNNNSDYLYTFTLRVENATPVIQTGTTVTKVNDNGTYITNYALQAGDLTSSSGVKIVGYGSDAFLALLNAINYSTYSSNVNCQLKAPYVYNSNTDANDYYSWYYSIFGLSDYYDLSTYQWKYWESTYGSGSWCSYSLGYYSNTSYGYNGVSDNYNLTYTYYQY